MSSTLPEFKKHKSGRQYALPPQPYLSPSVSMPSAQRQLWADPGNSTAVKLLSSPSSPIRPFSPSSGYPDLARVGSPNSPALSRQSSNFRGTRFSNAARSAEKVAYVSTSRAASPLRKERSAVELGHTASVQQLNLPPELYVTESERDSVWRSLSNLSASGFEVPRADRASRDEIEKLWENVVFPNLASATRQELIRVQQQVGEAAAGYSMGALDQSEADGRASLTSSPIGRLVLGLFRVAFFEVFRRMPEFTRSIALQMGRIHKQLLAMQEHLEDLQGQLVEAAKWRVEADQLRGHLDALRKASESQVALGGARGVLELRGSALDRDRLFEGQLDVELTELIRDSVEPGGAEEVPGYVRQRLTDTHPSVLGPALAALSDAPKALAVLNCVTAADAVSVLDLLPGEEAALMFAEMEAGMATEALEKMEAQAAGAMVARSSPRRCAEVMGAMQYKVPAASCLRFVPLPHAARIMEACDPWSAACILQAMETKGGAVAPSKEPSALRRDMALLQLSGEASFQDMQDPAEVLQAMGTSQGARAGDIMRARERAEARVEAAKAQTLGGVLAEVAVVQGSAAAAHVVEAMAPRAAADVLLLMTSKGASATFMHMRPAPAAAVLACMPLKSATKYMERFNTTTACQLLQHMEDPGTAAGILEMMLPLRAGSCLKAMQAPLARRMLDALQPAAVAHILHVVDIKAACAVLDLLEEARARLVLPHVDPAFVAHMLRFIGATPWSASLLASMRPEAAAAACHKAAPGTAAACLAAMPDAAASAIIFAMRPPGAAIVQELPAAHTARLFCSLIQKQQQHHQASVAAALKLDDDDDEDDGEDASSGDEAPESGPPKGHHAKKKPKKKQGKAGPKAEHMVAQIMEAVTAAAAAAIFEHMDMGSAARTMGAMRAAALAPLLGAVGPAAAAPHLARLRPPLAAALLAAMPPPAAAATLERVELSRGPPMLAAMQGDAAVAVVEAMDVAAGAALVQALEDGAPVALLEAWDTSKPAGRALVEALPAPWLAAVLARIARSAAQRICGSMGAQALARVLLCMDAASSAGLLQAMDTGKVALVVVALGLNAAPLVLREMDTQFAQKVMLCLDPARAAMLLQVLEAAPARAVVDGMSSADAQSITAAYRQHLMELRPGPFVPGRPPSVGELAHCGAGPHVTTWEDLASAAAAQERRDTDGASVTRKDIADLTAPEHEVTRAARVLQWRKERLLDGCWERLCTWCTTAGEVVPNLKLAKTRGAVQFEHGAITCSSAAAAARITVVRTGGMEGVVGCQVATMDGVGRAGADYKPVDLRLQWDSGDASPHTVDVPIVHDGLWEGGESFYVSLYSCTGGAVVGPQSVLEVHLVRESDETVPGGQRAGPRKNTSYSTPAARALEPAATPALHPQIKEAQQQLGRLADPGEKLKNSALLKGADASAEGQVAEGGAGGAAPAARRATRRRTSITAVSELVELRAVPASLELPECWQAALGVSQYGAVHARGGRLCSLPKLRALLVHALRFSLSDLKMNAEQGRPPTELAGILVEVVRWQCGGDREKERARMGELVMGLRHQLRLGKDSLSVLGARLCGLYNKPLPPRALFQVARVLEQVARLLVVEHPHAEQFWAAVAGRAGVPVGRVEAEAVCRAEFAHLRVEDLLQVEREFTAAFPPRQSVKLEALLDFLVAQAERLHAGAFQALRRHMQAQVPNENACKLHDFIAGMEGVTPFTFDWVCHGTGGTHPAQEALEGLFHKTQPASHPEKHPNAIKTLDNLVQVVLDWCDCLHLQRASFRPAPRVLETRIINRAKPRPGSSLSGRALPEEGEEEEGRSPRGFEEGSEAAARKALKRQLKDGIRLSVAVRDGRLEVLERLLEEDEVDPDSPDYDGNTALHTAAACDTADFAAILIEAGANVNALNRWGCSPLHEALVQDSHTTADILKENGGQCLGLVVDVCKHMRRNPAADALGLGGKRQHQGLTPGVITKFDLASKLLVAVATKNESKIEAFLLSREDGYDVNMQDMRSRTALHVAAADGSLQMVALLVEQHAAHLNLTDERGFTALADAQTAGHKAVSSYLAARGASDGRGMRGRAAHGVNLHGLKDNLRRTRTVSKLQRSSSMSNRQSTINTLKGGMRKSSVMFGRASKLITGMSPPSASSKAFARSPTGAVRGDFLQADSKSPGN